jgi:hypothetical protein
MLNWPGEIAYVDSEYHAPPGERPDPACMVIKLARSGRIIRLWEGEFGPQPPINFDESVLFVAFSAAADLGVFRVLGWEMPKRILDPYIEFRNRTNNIVPAKSVRLLTAMLYMGLDPVGASEKDVMHDIFIRGGPYTAGERQQGLDGCQRDVEALERLTIAMASNIDLPRALLRGRYAAAVSAMMHNGVPLDGDMLARMRGRWDNIKDELIRLVDADYHVFENREISRTLFEQYLAREGIPWWQRTATGMISLDDDVLRAAAKIYPQISPLRELKHALSDMRLNDLAVGRDNRNRAYLAPFGTRSGRNAPSSSRFVFGSSVWLRGLIKAPPGHAITIFDWSQQEFAIAAVHSKDRAMIAASESGDCYFAFGQQAGAIPADADPEDKAFRAIRGICGYRSVGMQAPPSMAALAQRYNGNSRGRLKVPPSQRPPDFARRVDEARDRAYPGREAAVVNEAHRRELVGS